MRTLLRADASAESGTGHVMRCLTLAEELARRGHAVALMGTVEVPWVADLVTANGLEVVGAPAATLDPVVVANGGWDAVVVDSYGIPPDAVSALDRLVPVLAIVDGDDRGIEATRYVDPNLGAERRERRPDVEARLSAGSRYALVQRSVVERRRAGRWRIHARPRVLVVFGGSDPTGATGRIAPALAPLADRADLTVVAAPAQHAALAGLSARIIVPTADLPAELDAADVVISAAGTSAWEIATLGIPAVFAAVIGNQRAGLAAILEGGIGLGVDASAEPQRIVEAAALASRLLDDADLRRRLAEASGVAFDGRGAERVAALVEALP